MSPPKCVRCNQPVVDVDDRKFSDDTKAHPMLEGPCHRRCYLAYAKPFIGFDMVDPENPDEFDEALDDGFLRNLVVGLEDDPDEGDARDWGY